jgi:hypothetical protein
MSTVPTTTVTKTDTEASASQPIRVLAFIEASSVTGPAKNLIEFARLSSKAGNQSNRVQVTIATFQRVNKRGNISDPNMFI